jgi:hypothetical protein
VTAVTFDFHIEPSAGGEQTWRVTADITREHGRYFAVLTGAYPEDAREYPSLYDVSDLEKALADDGSRTLDDVKQAAIDAFATEAA